MMTTERIDLHMPKSWAAMTVTELETVSRILLSSVQKGENIDM